MLLLLLFCLFAALFIHFFLKKKKEDETARLAGFLIGGGGIASALLLIGNSISPVAINFFLLRLTPLNILICTLIVFVSFIVHRFSIRYMAGDRFYRRYFIILSATTLSAITWVLADNIFLFWIGWTFSNVFLILLMIHKSKWEAAKNSGSLALKILMSGSFFLFIAIMFLYLQNNTTSLEFLIHSNHDVSQLSNLSLTLILLAALSQSALWPFHRWLISSLNSPTPVSALMHAGLVNGGGILIVKFAPLISIHQRLLTVLFLLGAISAFLGSIWKLLQNDIKRMLACSTMAQMGFMMMQCGLGLFSAAITHLCWHGLFKAYLFLSSGSVITETKPENNLKTNSFVAIILSAAGGLLAMCAFAYITDKPMFFPDPTTFLLALVFVTGAQITLTMQSHIPGFKKCILILPIALFSGILYGESIHLIESVLPNLDGFRITTLNMLHWIILIFFLMTWFAFNFFPVKKIQESRIWCRFYMMMLNQSQPHPKTITAIRDTYQF
nr:proton-conducting transporter membrane subunit [Legionella sp. PL877]